jgi:hypothetical protein
MNMVSNGFLVAFCILKDTNLKIGKMLMSITFNQKLAGAPPSNNLQCAYDAQGNMGNKFDTVCDIRNKLCEDGSTWAYVKVCHAD